jgi:RNA polymerase sigma factor (sigma-70 family)
MRSEAYRSLIQICHLGAAGNLTDLRLLERFVNGPADEASRAFEVLVDRYGPLVLRVGASVLRDPHAAEDAFQATFLVLLRRARTSTQQRSLGNWLYGVALRTARKARCLAGRRSTREQALAQRRSAADCPFPDSPDSPDWAQAIHEEIERLPAAYRSVVVLCYLEGMSYDAAAIQLGLSATAVRGRLARARNRLRQRLVRQDVTLPAGSLGVAIPASLRGQVPSGITTALMAQVQRRWGCAREAGLVSTRVHLIERGVLRTMSLERMRPAAALVVSLGLLSGGFCLLSEAAGARHQAPRQPIQSRLPSTGLALAPQAKPSATDGSLSGTFDPELVRRAGGTIVAMAPITKDCMVLSYIPDWNHGNVDNIGIGNYDGGYRTLFDWKALTPKTMVDGDRRYLLALYVRKSTGTEPPGPILAFGITGDWPERTSWRTMPDYDPEPAASFKFEPGEGWKVFDITPIIRAQERPGRTGHGLLLRFMNEDRSSRTSRKAEFDFASREAQGPDAPHRPIILITRP